MLWHWFNVDCKFERKGIIFVTYQGSSFDSRYEEAASLLESAIFEAEASLNKINAQKESSNLENQKSFLELLWANLACTYHLQGEIEKSQQAHQEVNQH